MARDRMAGGGWNDGRRGRPSRSRGASSQHQRYTSQDPRGARAPRGGFAASGGSSGGGSGRPPRGRRPQDDLFHTDLSRARFSRRDVVLGLGGLGMLAGLWKLADYQIVNAETYRSRADERRVSSQTLFAKRGTIYDRNGNVLTSSVECRNVYVNPKLVDDTDAAIQALVDTLGVDESECRKKVTSDTTFAYIKRQVDEEVAEELEDLGIKGIEFEQTMKRMYPYGNIASQVLGVVNIDNEGVSGLEHYYDDVLTGTNGSLVRERARDGSYIAGGAYQKVAAQNGTDLVLTLDVNIQQAAEAAIAEVVESSGSDNGSVVVTDPTTGEILACCSYPTYDQTDLANTDAASMNLRAVTDAYEPGSVFKTLVSGMAIDLGLMNPDTEFEVPARVKVGDDWVTDVDDRDYTMTMTLREILRRSSNTGMVLVGQEVGADHFAEYLDAYGIGSSSGVDFPGESLGIVRDRESYDGSTLGSMSFGQGIAVSPIEVVRAVSSIANGGTMTTPHFLKSKQGEEIDWTAGEESPISAKTAEQITSMMVTVVDEGTGEGAAISGYDVAGKTGTAERASETGGYKENDFMSSFIGFAPASDPKVMAYILLDGTAYHSSAATPVFKTIVGEALSVLGVEPTR